MSATKDALQKTKPWSKDAAWWVLLVEGIVLAGLGLYTLLWPASAAGSLVYILALVLLIDGIMSVVRGIRRRAQRRLNFVRSGVALLGGLLVVVMPLLGSFDTGIGAWIIGITFVVLGILRVVGFFVERRSHVRFIEVVIALGMFGIGGWMVWRLITGTASVQSLVPLGWLLLVLGGFMVAYSFFVRSQGQSDEPEAPKAPAAAKPAKAAAQPAAAEAPKTPAAEPSAPAAPADAPPPAAGQSQGE